MTPQVEAAGGSGQQPQPWSASNLLCALRVSPAS